MINLLPPKEKEFLEQEKIWRIILILGTLILISFLCFVLVLFSIKTYVRGEIELQKVLLAQEKLRLKALEIQRFQEEIASANQNLLKLESFYQTQFNLIDLLEKVSNTLPSGVSLTYLSIEPYSRERDYNFQVLLSGYAINREDLFEFKKNLEAEKDFKEIYLPPSSWIKPTDINFSIRFSI